MLVDAWLLAGRSWTVDGGVVAEPAAASLSARSLLLLVGVVARSSVAGREVAERRDSDECRVTCAAAPAAGWLTCDPRELPCRGSDPDRPDRAPTAKARTATTLMTPAVAAAAPTSRPGTWRAEVVGPSVRGRGDRRGSGVRRRSLCCGLLPDGALDLRWELLRWIETAPRFVRKDLWGWLASAAQRYDLRYELLTGVDTDPIAVAWWHYRPSMRSHSRCFIIDRSRPSCLC